MASVSAMDIVKTFSVILLIPTGTELDLACSGVLIVSPADSWAEGGENSAYRGINRAYHVGF